MKFNTIMKIIFIILSIAVGLLTCGLIGGCEILKSKQSRSSDSTAVTKKIEATSVDSSGGFVSKTESKSKNDYDRTTYLYQPGKDTNIINIYPKFNIPQQPYAVIHETGTTEQTNNKTDSGWYRFILQQFKAFTDSVNKQQTEKSKSVEKETKGVGLIAVILIAVAAVVVFKLLGWSFGKFTIVKRQSNS